MSDLATTALVPSVAIDAIIGERDAMVSAVERIEEILRAAPDKTTGIYLDGVLRRHYHTMGQEESDRRVERARKLADRHGWERLLEETGLRTFMDATARAEWETQMEKLTFLPLTIESADATIRGLHEQRGAMVARGVSECFRRLGTYKTNRADRFGRRMIVRYVTNSYGDTGRDVLDDLSRVLHVLRGLPEPDHRRGARVVIGEAKGGTASFPFFDVRLFKNGNGHLTMTHAADVLRLNKVLSVATGGASLAHGAVRASR